MVCKTPARLSMPPSSAAEKPQRSNRSLLSIDFTSTRRAIQWVLNHAYFNYASITAYLLPPEKPLT